MVKCLQPFYKIFNRLKYWERVPRWCSGKASLRENCRTVWQNRQIFILSCRKFHFVWQMSSPTQCADDWDGCLHRGDPFRNAGRVAHPGPTAAKAYPAPPPAGIPLGSLGHRLIPTRLADGCASMAPPRCRPQGWTLRGSGWVVDRVEVLWLDIARYQPLRGGCYIPLPAAVRLKKAVVNVKNKDNHCLRWALRSALFPVAHGQHTYRPSKYPQQDGLDFTGIDASPQISHIPRVVRQNDLAINVFGWDKRVIVHHISKQPEDTPRINLLLIEKAGKFHYAWIKGLNRLLHDQSKCDNRKHYCERSLHGYTREDLLEAHKPECRGIGQTAVRVKMREEGKNAQAFQNHHKQPPAPYIIYADFEALTAKVEGPELDPTKSNTQRTQHHEACSYSYIVVRCDGQTEPPVKYQGSNAAEHLLESLQEEERKIKGVLADPKAMSMTREDWHAFRATETCHVCDKPLEGDSVRDHCHITGKYRGAAHNAWNLKLRLNPKTTTIPVVFHNLRGYDSHLLMQAIEGGGRDKLYPQQHGEVYLLLPRATALHWQRPIPASLPRQAGCGKPARGFPDNSPTRAQQRKTGAPNEGGCVPLRVHGHLGLLHRARTPPQGRLLQQALWCAYQWRGLRPCAKGLGDLWMQDPGWLQRPVLLHQRSARWRVRDLSADLPKAVRSGPCSVLHQPRPFVGRLTQEDRRWAGAAYRLWPASIHREGLTWRHLNGLKAPHQSKQSPGRGVRPRAAK